MTDLPAISNGTNRGPVSLEQLISANGGNIVEAAKREAKNVMTATNLVTSYATEFTDLASKINGENDGNYSIIARLTDLEYLKSKATMTNFAITGVATIINPFLGAGVGSFIVAGGPMARYAQKFPLVSKVPGMEKTLKTFEQKVDGTIGKALEEQHLQITRMRDDLQRILTNDKGGLRESYNNLTQIFEVSTTQYGETQREYISKVEKYSIDNESFEADAKVFLTKFGLSNPSDFSEINIQTLAPEEFEKYSLLVKKGIELNKEKSTISDLKKKLSVLGISIQGTQKDIETTNAMVNTASDIINSASTIIDQGNAGLPVVAGISQLAEISANLVQATNAFRDNYGDATKLVSNYAAEIAETGPLIPDSLYNIETLAAIDENIKRIEAAKGSENPLQIEGKKPDE